MIIRIATLTKPSDMPGRCFWLSPGQVRNAFGVSYEFVRGIRDGHCAAYLSAGKNGQWGIQAAELQPGSPVDYAGRSASLLAVEEDAQGMAERCLLNVRMI